MDFAYTPAQQELKARAAAYAELLMALRGRGRTGRRTAAEGDGARS